MPPSPVSVTDRQLAEVGAIARSVPMGAQGALAQAPVGAEVGNDLSRRRHGAPRRDDLCGDAQRVVVLGRGAGLSRIRFFALRHGTAMAGEAAGFGAAANVAEQHVCDGVCRCLLRCHAFLPVAQEEATRRLVMAGGGLYLVVIVAGFLIAYAYLQISLPRADSTSRDNGPRGGSTCW
jgi:hypothetical protein